MSFFSDAKRSKGDVCLEPWVEEAYYNIFGSEKKGAKINLQYLPLSKGWRGGKVEECAIPFVSLVLSISVKLI